MLTSCQELLRRGAGKKGPLKSYGRLEALAKRLVRDEPTLMGLKADCVVECWPSKTGLTYREVFEYLRNALSHPCPQGGTAYPITGFSTVDSGSLSVEAYEFIQSSWVNNKGSALSSKFAPERTDEAARVQLESGALEWAANHSVDGLSVQQVETGRWRVFRGDKLFVPVLRLRLNVRQLRTFTLNLSDCLSAPLAEAVPAIA